MTLKLSLFATLIATGAAEAVTGNISPEFLALAGLILTASGTIYATNRSSTSANRGTAVSQVPLLWERNDLLERENRLYEATLALHEADRAARGLPPVPRPEAIS